MLFWVLVAFVILFGFVVFFGAPYVPSKPRQAREALSGGLYKLTDKDTLVDIGSGDGIVLRIAAGQGARAVGFEINPILVVLARLLSRKHPTVEVRLANFWRTDFPSDTTVVYTFGESRDIVKMANYVEQQATKLGRELVFISYAFEVANRKIEKKYGAYFLYRIKPLQ